MNIVRKNAAAPKKQELARFFAMRSGPMLVVLLLSVFANLLALTGPLYMMQVYDRVLGSRSVETLIALTLIMLFLYAVMGLFDICRSHIMSRIAAQFQTAFDRRVFRATLSKTKLVGPDSYYDAARTPSDIENVQRLISSTAFLALFDLPWTPVFIFRDFSVPSLVGLPQCRWRIVFGMHDAAQSSYCAQHTNRKPQVPKKSANEDGQCARKC